MLVLHKGSNVNPTSPSYFHQRDRAGRRKTSNLNPKWLSSGRSGIRVLESKCMLYSNVAMTTEIRQPLTVVRHFLATLNFPWVICCVNFPCSARNYHNLCVFPPRQHLTPAHPISPKKIFSPAGLASALVPLERKILFFLTTVQGSSH